MKINQWNKHYQVLFMLMGLFDQQFGRALTVGSSANGGFVMPDVNEAKLQSVRLQPAEKFSVFSESVKVTKTQISLTY